MAYAKVRTAYGHAAGNADGRWNFRSVAKRAARKRRRMQDRSAERGVS